MVLSIERIFLVVYVFRESNRYTDLVQEQFAEKLPETPVRHHNAVHRHIEKFRETGLELKPATTAYIRSISQADLQKVFANKIK
jgi:hypothetical protein